MNVIDRIVKTGMTQEKLARLVNVTPQAISYWRRTNRIPSRYVMLVSEITKIEPAVLSPFFRK